MCIADRARAVMLAQRIHRAIPMSEPFTCHETLGEAQAMRHNLLVSMGLHGITLPPGWELEAVTYDDDLHVLVIRNSAHRAQCLL